MPNDQTEFGKGRPDLSTVKEMRREHPSGWLELAKDPARALLIDTLLDSPPGHEFSPGEISPRAGISDQSVRNHIDILVERGLVERINETRYRLKDNSRVMRALEELNGAVNAVRSGAVTKRRSSSDPEEIVDNSDRESTAKDLIDSPPSNGGKVINAD